MASASAPGVDVVKCGICLDQLRDPRSLLCAHSFCKECLESWLFDRKDTTNSIICPQCKTLTPIPSGGVDAFGKIDMADKVQVDYTQMFCSKCTTSPNRKATVYCQNCTAYLCVTCFDLHKAWPDFKPHVTVTMEDLSSGKVHISKTEDQVCTKHEGEHKKFYCATCQQLVCRDCIVMKQHCRDHDYVTLKEAAEEKMGELKQAMKKCDAKRKECQAAIQQGQAITTKLNTASENANRINELVKTDFLKQVEHFYKNQKDSNNKQQHIEEEKLRKANKLLQDNLQQIASANTRCQTLVESGSQYNIVANSKSMLETVKQVNQMTINKVNSSLVNFPTYVSSIAQAMGEFKQSWKQIGGFKVDCKNHLTGIAVTSDGKVAVCDWYNCVKVLSQSGDLLHTFDGTLGGEGDICITNDDTYLYPLFMKSACKHNINYQVISKFKTVNASKQLSIAWVVTVDKNGLMIFGMADKAISIHNPDGSPKCSYTIPYRPSSVAVTSNAEVIVASYGNHSVQLFDYSGNCLHTLDPPDEVKPWSWNPRYVRCSTADEVFVANRGEPKAVYKYIAGRVYMGCVTREVDDPWGIALSHDDQILYVTEFERKMVKKFQRP